MAHRLEYQTLYEIFRACRLCGVDEGKMPIIQNIFDLEIDNGDLQKKIRDCVQIEVKENDKMPPLICLSCTNKVNDYFEFLEMCWQTNKRTRTRLGLPSHSMPKEGLDSEDCILGVTEQICPESNLMSPMTRPGPKSLKHTLVTNVPMVRNSVSPMTRPGPKSRKQTLVTNVPKASNSVSPMTRPGPKSLKHMLVTNVPVANNSVSLITRPGPKSLKHTLVTNVPTASNSVSPMIRPGPKSLKHTLVRNVKIARDDSDKSVGKKEVEWSIKGNDDEKGKGKKDGKEKKDDKDKSGKGKKEGVHKKVDGRRWQKELQDLKMQTDFSMLDSSRSSRSSRNESRSSSTSSPSSRGQLVSPGGQPPESSASTRLRHQELPSRTDKPKQAPPKSILKKEKDIKTETSSDEETLLVPRGKRTREKNVVTLEPQPKKVKLNVAPKPSPPPKPSPKAITKSTKPPPPPPNSCTICHRRFKTHQSVSNHMRSHTVTFTKQLLACNACGEWFADTEEAVAHHKRHRTKSIPYHCRRCGFKFKHQKIYEEHFAKQCVPWRVAPDVKCTSCLKTFVTKTLRDQHKCTSLQSGGRQCGNCGRYYASQKSLNQHQKKCLKKKVLPNLMAPKKWQIDPKMQSKLKQIKVRVARCDPILRYKRGHYDVSNMPALFGLDKHCVYPFSHGGVRIKSKPLNFDGMVSIKQEIRNEFYKEEDYVHWDSDLSTDSEEDETETTSLLNNSFARKRRVDSLTTLSLKTIFSKRCIGKVPRKLRKVKSDKLFDSLFNAIELENNDSFNNNINNIIGSLGDADENETVNLTVDNDVGKLAFGDNVSTNVNYDSDSLLEDQDKTRVRNSDFDSLFKSDDVSRSNDNDKEVENNNRNEGFVKNDVIDTQVQNVDSSADKELSVNEGKDSKTEDDEHKDTLSLNSQISDKTDYESGSQNGELKNSDLDPAIVENNDINDITDKVNGNSDNSDNYNDIINTDVETKFLDEGSETKSKALSSSEREKVEKLSLDDVVSNKDDLKSLDLDNVSDEECNFDV